MTEGGRKTFTVIGGRTHLDSSILRNDCEEIGTYLNTNGVVVVTATTTNLLKQFVAL